MQFWKPGAWSAALVTTAGLGAAIAPVAHGQGPAVHIAQAPHALEIFTGGGSRIGVSIREVEEGDVKEAGLPGIAGALVEDVTEGSPAEQAGIKQGDVIVEFDGERVRGVRHLTRLVQETPDGRQVQTVIVREGQRTTVSIAPRESAAIGLDGFRHLEKLGREFSYNMPARPAPPARRRTVPPSVWQFEDLLGRGGSSLGISVDTLSPQLAEYFGTKEGVLVTTVNDDSTAAKAGMKAGDVITAINGSTVNDPADLRRRIQDLDEGDEFTISVIRDRKPQTLKAKLERAERIRRRTNAA